MAAILFECKLKKAREDRNTITDEDDKCIPEEILFQDILVRLPIKPLLRFKSVSKRWRYLIHSPSFVTSHRRHHFRDDSWGKLVQTPYTDAWKYSPSLFKDGYAAFDDVIDDPYPTSYSPLFINLIDPCHHPVLPPQISIDRLELPHPKQDGDLWTRRISVFGPLNNGIYCIFANLEQHIELGRGFAFRNIVRVDTCKIAFCNPGTRDYKFANPFPSEIVPHLMTRCDGSSGRCQVYYGFGNVDMDYKVVVVLACTTSFLSTVYSHRRGTWETLIDYELGKRDLFKPKVMDGIALRTQGNVRFPIINEDSVICPQGFFNGCWHWMAWKPDDYSSIVLSFHMGDQVFKFFGGAPGYFRVLQNKPAGAPAGARFSNGLVSVLNHHLAAIYIFYYSTIVSGDSDSIFDVWMMMEYGVEESWTKIYTVHQICPIFSKLVGIKSSLRDNCIGGIQIKKIVYIDDKGRLISCDDTVVQNHGLFDDSASMYWNTLGFTAYSETLESVNISVEEDDDGAATNSG